MIADIHGFEARGRADAARSEAPDPPAYKEFAARFGAGRAEHAFYCDGWLAVKGKPPPEETR